MSPTRRGETTGSMAVYDGERRSEPGVVSRAGLVLTYSPGYKQLQPAYPLTAGSVTIGREPPADILVPQPAVSRSHANLSFDGHQWAIRDLGARNGTLVNGVFVTACPLRHNDDIRVGDAFFKFVQADADLYVPYRLDGAVINAHATPSGIVGGFQLARISGIVERIAKSPMSIIVLGASGTGKEVFARQIHTWSGRPGSFCALNCAAIPNNLLESELFGYRRGAFSGADRDHVGHVRAADHGTLFLDEVGDLPLEAQAKLLRVLQSKEVVPLGATSAETVDVRIVCATHRNLAAMQAEQRFRGDLFARLNEYSVTLPPLSERKEDIYALCLEFLRLHKRPDLELSVPYMTGLLHYHFPYNIRELEALIKRGIALTETGSLEAEHLSTEIHEKMAHYGRRQANAAGLATSPDKSAPPAPSWVPPAATQHPLPPVRSLVDTLDHTGAATMPQPPASSMPAEAELRELLQTHGGNVAAVGRHYGKERMQVHRWMRKYGIDPNHYRGG